MKYAPAATSVPSVVIRNAEMEREGAGGGCGWKMDCWEQEIRASSVTKVYSSVLVTEYNSHTTNTSLASHFSSPFTPLIPPPPPPVPLHPPLP